MGRFSIAFILALCTLTAQELQRTCGKGLVAEFPSGSDLTLNIRASETDITGTNDTRLRIVCEFKDRPNLADRVKIDYKAAGKGFAVSVRGGHSRDLHLRIEVPRNTNLTMHSRYGDVRIDSVTGNKDVELRAGDLTISVGNPADYAHADASVKIGDLTAFAFDVTKDGWNRRFEKENPGGKYRLHAHVGVGDLILQQ
jgi:hypothetical protein